MNLTSQGYSGNRRNSPTGIFKRQNQILQPLSTACRSFTSKLIFFWFSAKPGVKTSQIFNIQYNYDQPDRHVFDHNCTYDSLLQGIFVGFSSEPEPGVKTSQIFNNQYSYDQPDSHVFDPNLLYRDYPARDEYIRQICGFG